MITRKTNLTWTIAKPWILTPETSPQLAPAVLEWDADDEASMSTDDLTESRPISIEGAARDGTSLSSMPTLDDILGRRSQPPYTLSAFTAFLSHQHCLETLEFTKDAKQYQDEYAKQAARLAPMAVTYDHPDVRQLQQDWERLLANYIKPGSQREINLPAEERDDLLDQRYLERPRRRKDWIQR